MVEDEGNTPLLRPVDQVSVAAWINLASSQPDSTRLVIKGRNDYESYATETEIDGFSFFIRDPNRSLTSVDSEAELPLDEWVHIAGTYNNDNNDLKVYVNGQVDANETVGGDVELFADANDGLGIGGRYGDSQKRFDGSFDDVRVYNRGLTRAEVAYLASQSTGTIPLDSEANLYSGEAVEAVNIRDLAVLLDHWLEVKLWP
ncbi:MAG: LamG domain-containing protein [Planctomycetota bacterium]